MTRTLSIAGSTGSVGRSALSVVEHANALSSERCFEIHALTAHRDVERLAKQAIAFEAKVAVIGDATLYEELKERLSGSGVEAAAGHDAITDVASAPVDRFVAAIVGFAGLESTHAALAASNGVALANKESMVCAGPLLKRVAKASGAAIVPTDSEHNAIFQVLERRDDVERLLLTASGGPFLNTPLDSLHTVTPDQACDHPRWSMGRKISVDSATFVNKALELIEASYLFDVPEEQIDVLVHPQSIVHSLVAYRDGSVLAQLGVPDMKTPIAHSLSWPERRLPTEVSRLDLAALGQLDFQAVDDARFPAIRLARQALQAGGSAPVVMNAANECAVEAFLSGECRFTDISWIVEDALEQAGGTNTGSAGIESLSDVRNVDGETRRLCGTLIEKAREQMRSNVQ
ncbi:1-deoxy-D-xylulose-5-phosphate reductoisomerase [Henriciella aquimarina]|uniref:1-deoxy-D-xylulose-5-phosphate reductoisomerase n=1 Tax=Henriciella aquimarina TaxID=545261 RepID=UPI000A047155|nr:1-deoxy-D-xylulose-5-phosphate reductoisomerase [Henriciella aquimarina]